MGVFQDPQSGQYFLGPDPDQQAQDDQLLSLGVFRDPMNGDLYQAPQSSLSNWTRPQPIAAPQAPTPDLESGVRVADYARTIMAGGAQLVEGLGWATKMLGAESIGGEIETLGRDAVDFWNEGLSDAAKRELSKEFVRKNAAGEYEWGDASLNTVGLFGAQSLLGTMAGAGVGAGVTKVLQVFANPVGRSALIAAARGGSAQALSKLKLVDQVIGAGGFGLGEGAIAAPQSGLNVYKAVMSMPPEKLLANPRYQQVYKSTDERIPELERHQMAAEAVAKEASSLAGMQAGLTSALLGAPIGAYFGKLFGSSALGKLAGGSRLTNALTGAGGEAAQEFAQSGVQQFIENRTRQDAGDDVELLDDVLNQALGGALAGAPIGGVLGASERPSLPPSADSAAPSTKPLAGAVPGAATNVSGEMPLQAQYQLADVDHLIASHDIEGKTNPAFPADLQPRDRARSASRQWIDENTATFQHEPMIEGVEAGSGAPIVDSSGVVESGNGRVNLLRNVYDKGKGKAYKDYLRANATKFGLKPADVERMERPALVRVRQQALTPEQRVEFTRSANRPTVAAMAPAERAKADAASLDDASLAQLDVPDDGNVLAPSNRKFVSKFLQGLPAAERGGLLTAEGDPTKQVGDRIKAALFSKAYGDDRLLALMAEESDRDIGNVVNALVRAAPAYAKAGDVGFDLTGPLVEGIEAVREARRKGQAPEEYLRQQGMFANLSPEARGAAELVADNLRTPRKLAEALTAMASYAEKAAAPTGDLLGTAPPRTFAGALAAAGKGSRAIDASTIPRDAGLKPADRKIESAMAEKIASDPAAAEREYAQIKGTLGGKLLNTDLARELSPDYLKDRKKSQAVHEPASWIVKQLYAKRLAEQPEVGDLPEVLFTAGGTGAGKTTGLSEAAKINPDVNRAQIIYDTNMNGAKSSIQKIEQALAAGKTARIVYTYRDPVDSLVNGALKRAATQAREYGSGRTVPLTAHAETHVGSASTIREIAQKYKDDPRVQILAINNSAGKGGAKVMDLSEIPDLQYDTVLGDLHAALDREHAAGRVPEDVYHAFRGDGGPEARPALAGQGGQPDEGDRVGVPARPAQAVDQPLATSPLQPAAAAAEALAAAAERPAPLLSRGGPAPRDDSDSNPIKPGEPFYVFRAADRDGLIGTNAGNAEGVSGYLADLDDFEKPANVGSEKTDTVFVYEAVAPEGFEPYQRFNQGRPGGQTYGRVGRAARGNSVIYSFPEGAKFEARLLGRVPLADVRAELKKVAGYTSFDDAGTLKTAEALKTLARRMVPDLTLRRGASTARQTKAVEDVRTAIASVIDGVAPLINVQIHPNIDAMRRATGDWTLPSDTYGGWIPGDSTVHLVADTIPPGEEQKVAVHEIFGHLAMERYEEGRDAIAGVRKQIEKGAEWVQPLVDEVRSRYGDISDTELAKEVIAHMAERGQKNTIMGGLIAGMKRFLRRLGVSIDYSDAEVREIIARSARALRDETVAKRNFRPKLQQLTPMSSDAEIVAALDEDIPPNVVALDTYLAARAQANEAMIRSLEEEPDLSGTLSLKEPPKALLSRAAPASPEVQAILDRVMAKPPEAYTMKDRIRQIRDKVFNLNTLEIKQGLIDSFASIEDLEREVNSGKLLDAASSAYKSMLATKNLPSVMAAVMLKGVPEFKNGVYQPVAGRKGVLDIFKPLTEHPDGNLLHQWEGFAAAVRADRLIKEQNPDGTNREQLFTQPEIDELLKLGQQYPVFSQVWAEWQAFNKQMLDLAEAAGIIDPVSRAQWERNDYVPFYRAQDVASEGKAGPRNRRGVANQRADIKRLRGSDKALGNVFENMMLNTAHLLDASFKNRAMQKVVDLGTGTALTPVPLAVEAIEFSDEQLARALSAAGLIVGNPQTDPYGVTTVAKMTQQQKDHWTTLFRRVAPRGPGIVSMMKDGKPLYFEVNDPLVLNAIAGMGYDNFSDVMGLFRGSKKLLTHAITADPAFMLANFVRDTLSNWVVSDASTKPLTGALSGLAATFTNDPVLMQIMMAGAGGGGFYDSNPDEIRKLIATKVSHSKKPGVVGSVIGPHNLWQTWRKIGSAAENANRVAVFRSVLKAGGSVAEAAYQARDVLNFSMSGDYSAMRWLTQSVPFLNARIQGLYRLYRGARDNRRAFFIKGAMLMAATMALALKNRDEPDYEELPEWDKDTYWHLFVGGEHYRIPKPFEVGAMFATMPERLMRTATGRDSGKILLQRIAQMMSDTFAFNPTPQLVKPIIEQYANRSMFTGSPIVGMAEQSLQPEAQFTPWTSPTMRELAQAMPDFAPEWLRSPRRLEAGLRAYTGALGMYVLSASDVLTRNAFGYPEEPSRKLQDLPVVARFWKDPQPRHTKYADLLYDYLNEVNATYSTINRFNREQRFAEARELKESNRPKLAVRTRLNRIGTNVRNVNEQIRRIQLSRTLDGTEKRERIDALVDRKNILLRQIAPFADLF